MLTPPNRPLRSAASPLTGGLLACSLLSLVLLASVSLGVAPFASVPAAFAQEAASAEEPAPAEGVAPAQVFANHSGTGPGPSGATETRSSQENARLYQSLKGFLMSPYCPGLTLGSCGSGAAELLRLDLREWVDAGLTRDAIVSYYVGIFGEEFLGRPPFRGSAIVVWVAPIVALLVGLFGIALWLRRAAPSNPGGLVNAPGADPTDAKSIDPETEARLEAEIRSRYG